jgi:transcriptional regulator with XRE-family HTH domain
MTDIPGRQQLTGYRLRDPGTFGPTLGILRHQRGVTRRMLAARIAVATGRDEKSVYQQLAAWENAQKTPNMSSLREVLAALDLDLALIPREEA